jgi:ribonucleoside-diphosphate reductase alpha chain
MSSSLMLVKKDEEPAYSTFYGSHLSKGKFQFNLWGIEDSDLSGRWDWDALRREVMLHGVRNSLLIALMPTASTSSIFNNIEGTECITSNMYTRNVMSGVFTIINKHLVKDLKTLKLWNQDTIERLMFDKGSVQNLKNFPAFLKDVYRTVFETNQKDIIKMSADRGLFVCQSQSLNLFFDKPTFKEITSAHFYGWKLGLKTGMYYLRTKSAKSAQNFGLSVKTEKKLLQENIDKSLSSSSTEECLSCSA